MGWKASTIIINKPTPVDNEKLLQELGFSNLTRIADELFEVAIYPDDNKLYIGTYNDNLLICAPDIPMQFFEVSESATEKILTRIFPTSEICTIILQSTVNLWGFSVTKNGKRLRTKAGSSDDGTFLEYGEPLEEEMELLSKATIGEDGLRTYIFDDIDDEPMTEDQVGENFVFEICKRYFDAELDSVDDLLFETTLKGYSYSKLAIPGNKTEHQNSSEITTNGKSWWKFW